MAAFDPVKVLENVINKLRQHDPMGFFDDPVTDVEAPNYSQVISQPMCFSAMREKVRNREYGTWGSFIGDFELICQNATIYNQIKSRVHKAAKTMLKQGKADLQDAELEGRKAIYLLHPGGPADASKEEAFEFSSQGQTAPINAFLLCPGHVPLPPPIPDTEEEVSGDYYSCYSDTESEDMRGQGPPVPGALERFLQGVDKTVVWQPWTGGVGGAQERANRKDYLGEWVKRRQHIEWQCRWLELRLLELQSQRYRYNTQRAAIAARLGRNPVLHPDPTKKKHDRAQIPDVSSSNFLAHPFFSLRAGVESPEDFFGKLEGTENKEESDVEGEECLGARVHVALGVLTEEVKKVMGLLQARKKMCHTSHNKSVASRPQKKSQNRQPKPLARLDSKRSRREFEMDEVVTPYGLGAASTSIDRPVKTNIAVPKVSVLTEDDLTNRNRALDAWRPFLVADKNTRQVPKEVEDLLMGLDEGSSEEEMSDSAFLERHREMETTEHERHVAVFGPQKKHKSGQKVGDEGGGLASGQTSQYEASYASMIRGRGRSRGRGTGQRGRPPLTGRRSGVGLNLGIPTIPHMPSHPPGTIQATPPHPQYPQLPPAGHHPIQLPFSLPLIIPHTTSVTTGQRFQHSPAPGPVPGPLPVISLPDVSHTAVVERVVVPEEELSAEPIDLILDDPSTDETGGNDSKVENVEGGVTPSAKEAPPNIPTAGDDSETDLEDDVPAKDEPGNVVEGGDGQGEVVEVPVSDQQPDADKVKPESTVSDAQVIAPPTAPMVLVASGGLDKTAGQTSTAVPTMIALAKTIPFSSVGHSPTVGGNRVGGPGVNAPPHGLSAPSPMVFGLDPSVILPSSTQGPVPALALPVANLPHSNQRQQGLALTAGPVPALAQNSPALALLTPVVRQGATGLSSFSFTTPLSGISAPMSTLPWSIIQEIRVVNPPGSMPGPTVGVATSQPASGQGGGLPRLPSGVLDIVEKPAEDATKDNTRS